MKKLLSKLLCVLLLFSALPTQVLAATTLTASVTMQDGSRFVESGIYYTGTSSASFRFDASANNTLARFTISHWDTVTRKWKQDGDQTLGTGTTWTYNSAFAVGFTYRLEIYATDGTWKYITMDIQAAKPATTGTTYITQAIMVTKVDGTPTAVPRRLELNGTGVVARAYWDAIAAWPEVPKDGNAHMLYGYGIVDVYVNGVKQRSFNSMTELSALQNYKPWDYTTKYVVFPGRQNMSLSYTSPFPSRILTEDIMMDNPTVGLNRKDINGLVYPSESKDITISSTFSDPSSYYQMGNGPDVYNLGTPKVPLGSQNQNRAIDGGMAIILISEDGSHDSFEYCGGSVFQISYKGNLFSIENKELEQILLKYNVTL